MPERKKMKFSIILPTYNRAKFIKNAINSVLNQTFIDFELIIIDDGSTDHTREIVTNIKDSRIKYHYQENAERSAARNKGIELAKGRWICFLDSDDEYLPNHLAVINEEIDSDLFPKLLVTGNIIRKSENEKKHNLLDSKENLLIEISTKFILMNSVCVHADILRDNKFNNQFRIWEDTHLWLRIAAQFPIIQLQKYTVIQNIHENGTVVQGMKKIRLKEVLQYISAVQDLRDNYAKLFEGKLPVNYFNQYINSKNRMYLYQARQNKQVRAALQICWKALCLKPSFYLLSELPKIFLNKLNIGIHEG